MVVGAKVCDLTDGFLRFVCGLYVGILTSPLIVFSKMLLCTLYIDIQLTITCND